MFTRVVLGLMVGLLLVAPGTSAAGAGDARHAGGADISPIPTTRDSIRGDLAVWTALVFLVLLAVLWKYAWRPIADGLEKRERRIADEITSAERSNADAGRLLEEYRRKLAASGEEVQQMLDAARRDAEKVGHEMVEQAKTEARAEHQRALEEIDLATAGALKELAERSAVLAVELAGKIVRAKLDPNAHARLIEQAVSNFSKTTPGNN